MSQIHILTYTFVYIYIEPLPYSVDGNQITKGPRTQPVYHRNLLDKGGLNGEATDPGGNPWLTNLLAIPPAINQSNCVVLLRAKVVF